MSTINFNTGNLLSYVDNNIDNFTEFEQGRAESKKRKEPTSFKMPGKPSKQTLLLFKDYAIVPVSHSYTEACYMALYLKKLSVTEKDEYNKILEIFNNSITNTHRKSELQLYSSLEETEKVHYFPAYEEHLDNSMVEAMQTTHMEASCFPPTSPKNTQVYLYRENEIGISMLKKTFPDPSKQKIKILGSVLENQKMLYSVIIKR